MSKVSKNIAQIGILGGSGFYQFFKQGKEININTPHGKPSNKILIAKYQGKTIAFLPRHGRNHHLPPHAIPYKANIYALKKLGVKRIIASSASGSLKSSIKPGDFVITDQFVDRTTNRDDTFYHGPKVVHISSAEPYCPELRKIAIKVCRRQKVSFHSKGTIVVIQGPRYSTKAESRWFSKMGWDLVNMTQYPEAALAREAELCYLNISLITDYDVGLEGNKDIKPVTTREVKTTFAKKQEALKKIIKEIIKCVPEKPSCECRKALEGASM